MRCPKCGCDFEPEVTALAVSVNAAAVRAQTDSRKLREAAYRHAAEIVFKFWREFFGHSATRCRLTATKERFIVARLRENDGDVSELLYAAEGARRDPALNGENDRGVKYLGVENIYRNRERVERLVGLTKWAGTSRHPFLGNAEP